VSAGNDVPVIDERLEELTAALVRLTGEARFDEQVVVESGGGWALVAWVDEDTFAMDLVPSEPGAFERLDDYQLAVIYGLGFEDEEAEDDSVLFRQEFEYEAGEEWEEQALRELALLGLGLLRDVLHCSPERFTVSMEPVES